MLRPIIALCLLLAAVLVVAGHVGCSNSSANVDPAVVAEHRTRLLLAEEPDGVQTVLDVREALLGEIEEAHHDHGHDEHAEHDHDEHAGHDIDEHAENEHDEHADHDDDEHAEHDEHAGHDIDEHAENEHDEHAGHDDDEHAEHDEHLGHDHDEAAEPDHDEHAGHDHDEHAGHDHDEHQHDESVAVVAATEPMDVVLVGQIGGLANPWQETQPEFPFSGNRTQFFLADPGAVVEASGHAHAPGEECAFCEANAADNSEQLALVRFVDKSGHVLPIDARQLFDLKEHDTVVVRGVARVIEGGMMVVDASALYVRR